MSRKISERTLMMIEGYPELHKAGLSNVDIAKSLGVNYKTLLRHLPEIAQNMGVPVHQLKRVLKKPEDDFTDIVVCSLDELHVQADELSREISALALELKEKQARLEAVCQKIEEMDLAIDVSSGEIFVNGKLCETQLDAEDVLELAKKAIVTEECYGIQVGDISILASLAEIIEHCVAYVIEFDDKELEKAFNALIA